MSRADLPTHATPYFIGIIRDVSRQIDTGADSPAERTRLQHFITEQTRALASACNSPTASPRSAPSPRASGTT